MKNLSDVDVDVDVNVNVKRPDGDFFYDEKQWENDWIQWCNHDTF